jgi:hypothetical protein
MGVSAHVSGASPEVPWFSRPSAPHAWSKRAWCLLLILPFLLLPACDSEPATLANIQKTAATGRAAAATALRNAFYAKTITANGAINLAHARFDTSTTPPASPTATDITFAGAVLDFLAQCEPDIDKKVLNEFFWMRVGTLAANAAAAAEKAGDTPTARSLVLAGPKRWQTDAYWRQCPSHDALASIILFKSDEGAEALQRLQDRPDLADEVQQAKTMIEQEVRKGHGKKP